MIILLSFVSHAIVACFLRFKITKIKIISKIDSKITLQHKSQVNKLTQITCALALIRVVHFICQILAHSLTDGYNCHFQLAESPALNQLIFFFQEPFFNLIMIVPFLILFWRHRLSRSAQASLMAMGLRSSGFKNSHGGAKSSNHSKVTSSSTLGWKLFHQFNGEEPMNLEEQGRSSGWKASFIEQVQSKNSSTVRKSMIASAE